MPKVHYLDPANDQTLRQEDWWPIAGYPCLENGQQMRQELGEVEEEERH